MMWNPSRYPGCKPVPSAELARRRAKYPGLPDEYWSFLEEVGAGDVCGISFYPGPTKVDSEELDPGFVVIGDDRAGMLVGFSPAQGQAVYTVEMLDSVAEPATATLREFLEEWCAPAE